METLVAALIIFLMIMGAAAAMRKGAQVSALDRQRNQVRQELISLLEDSTYLFSRYELLPIRELDSNLTVDDFGTSGTADDIVADLHKSVVEVTTQQMNGVVVPYKLIKLTASWTSLDGSDTYSLEKRICLLQF